MTLDQYVAWLVRADDMRAIIAFFSFIDGPAHLEKIDGDGPGMIGVDVSTSEQLLDLVLDDDNLWFIRKPFPQGTDGGSIWRTGDFLGFHFEVDCEEIDDYDRPSPDEIRELQVAARRLDDVLDAVVERVDPLVACTCAYTALVGDGPSKFAEHVTHFSSWPGFDWLPPFRWYADGRWFSTPDTEGIRAVQQLR